MKSSVLGLAVLTLSLAFVNPALCEDKPAAKPAAEKTPAKSGGKSEADKNKETARLWYEEAIVKENPKSLDSILAKGVVLELAPSYVSPATNTNKVTGADQVKKHVAAVNKGGDYSGEIVDLVAEGNKVAMYRVVTEKMADGRTAVVPWVSFFEFDKEGKISKIKHVHDTLHEKNQFDKSKKK